MSTPRAFAWDDQIHFAYDGGIEVELYDLLFHDTDDIKPASSQADAGAEALNQQNFAAAFAGVALEAKPAAAAADTHYPVAAQFTGEFDCASATWEVGDLVAVVEAASGTELEDQKLVKTADAASAIGYCIRREAAATTRVRVRLLSRVAPNYLPAS